MISKIIQYFGTFLIIAFCSISIFFSLAEREIDDPSIRKFLSYPSFFEDRFYDYRMKSTLDPNKVDKRLVLVAIDDNSLRKLGKWPVPRIYWVKLMKKLQTFGAKVIAYDVFFSEMSNSCDAIPPEKLMAETIKDIQKDPKRHVILPYSLDTQNAEYFKEIPDTLYNFLMDTKQGENLNLDAKKVSKAVFPISILADTEAGLAHIEAEGDSDGIFRHYQVLGNVDTLYFPSFSLMAYQYYTGDKPVLEVLSIGDATLKLKTGDLKLNYKGESKVRWLGDQANFPFVSMYDVLMAEDDDAKMIKLLKDNIIFIGSTSFGAHDLRHTPVNAMLPGIYFHMNMVNMLLDGKFYVPQSDSTQISWALLFGGTLVMLLIMIFGNALLDVFTMMSLVTGLYLFDTYYLLPGGYEIKLFFCLMSVVACYSWNTFIHFYFASKDKKFLKEAFSTYISPELIDEMYDAGEPPKLGGDCGVRTAFFTDIQGFSTFSEKLSATQLVELLNEYLTAMTDILLEEMGTLDKYEGDAIIAFFGAPMPLEDHATRAVSVAHRMQEKLLELRVKWEGEGDKWPQIVHDMRMRVGLNSGEIVTGNMGSTQRMNYTMMGDSVNLAARLEESAKQYGIFTHVSKATMELAGKGYIWREVDTVKVVGKSVAVTTFDLLFKEEGAPEYLVELADKFKIALDHYKAQQWDQAIALFKETTELEYQRYPKLKGVKTNPSEIYIERSEQFKKAPPGPDWDGVYTLTSK